MKKLVVSASLLVLGTVLLLVETSVRAETHDVTYTANTLSTLVLEITPGDTFDLGNLTFNYPVAAPATGTVVSVTTNAANGYTLGVSDGITGTDSSLVNVADGVTRIPDMTNGTLATPVLWGANSGFGITLFSADKNKEAKWGTGAAYDDPDNKYAAIPETAVTAHTATGFNANTDTSSWAYMVETGVAQKTGAYSGSMTFTATAILI